MKLLKILLGIIVFGVVAVLGNYWIMGWEPGGVEHGPQNEEEHLFGFIRSIDEGSHDLLFDDAHWLNGAEGEAEAIRRGLCTEGTRADCLPNDYIIANEHVATEPLSYIPMVKIVMQTWRMEEEGEVAEHRITLEEFIEAINDEQAHWHSLPYDLVLERGVVTEIHERYVP